MMMGLPESGKSTFVAALWQVARSADVPEAMTLGTLKGDYSYIISLHKRWSEGLTLDRTEVGEEGIISIPLKSRSQKSIPADEIELILPDLSGESFDQQWEKRTMLTEYHTHLTEATGLLLFVHSQKFNPGELLGLNTEELGKILIFDDDEKEVSEAKVEMKDPAGRDEIEDDIQPEDASAPLAKPVEFDPHKVPTQTKVVDLLQQAFWLAGRGRIQKVALIISAWDLVKDRIASPSEWLYTAMPLLSQYLKSNGEQFSYRIYGVSGQGHEYSKESRVALTGERDPSKRIKVIDRTIVNNNITAPLQWLMDK
jgi:hypothetical protein